MSKELKLVIRERFENLKNEISNIIDSLVLKLNYETLIFKYLDPEILKVSGFLFNYLNKLNPPDDPLTSTDVKLFFDFYCDPLECPYYFPYDYYEAVDEEKLMIIRVMKTLEMELFNFLKSKRNKNKLIFHYLDDSRGKIWKIKNNSPDENYESYNDDLY